jgi:hypothetical protein
MLAFAHKTGNITLRCVNFCTSEAQLCRLPAERLVKICLAGSRIEAFNLERTARSAVLGITATGAQTVAIIRNTAE